MSTPIPNPIGLTSQRELDGFARDTRELHRQEGLNVTYSIMRDGGETGVTREEFLEHLQEILTGSGEQRRQLWALHDCRGDEAMLQYWTASPESHEPHEPHGSDGPRADPGEFPNLYERVEDRDLPF